MKAQETQKTGNDKWLVIENYSKAVDVLTDDKEKAEESIKRLKRLHPWGDWCVEQTDDYPSDSEYYEIRLAKTPPYLSSPEDACAHIWRNESKPICMNCRYAEYLFVDRGRTRFECRKNPPTINHQILKSYRKESELSVAEEIHLSTFFPIVLNNGWCGSWEKAK